MVVVTALKWSFLSELVGKLVQPIVFITLAQILTPVDFGILTSALLALAFAQIFWEAGIAKALIQRVGNIDLAANMGFWINMLLGAIVAACIYVASPLLADRVFHDTTISVVLRVMTVNVLLGGLCAVPAALMQREMRFKELFWIRVSTSALPAMASIPMAFLGMGFWALVTGAIAGQVIQTAMLWRLSTWRPSLGFDHDTALEMARFCMWSSTSGLLAWFYLWGDSMIVATTLGSHDVGLYRTGSQLSHFVFAGIFAAATPVLYSHISNFGARESHKIRAASRSLRTLPFVALPTAALVFSLSHIVARVLFGDNWDGIDAVIAFTSLASGIAWVVGMNGEIFRAFNKPHFETIPMALAIVLYLPAYLISAQHGLSAFLITKLLVTIIGVGVQFYMLGLLNRRMRNYAAQNAIRVLAITVACFLPLLWGRSFASDSMYAAMTLATTACAAFFLYRNGGHHVIADGRRFLRKSAR